MASYMEMRRNQQLQERLKALEFPTETAKANPAIGQMGQAGQAGAPAPANLFGGVDPRLAMSLMASMYGRQQGQQAPQGQQAGRMQPIGAQMMGSVLSQLIQPGYGLGGRQWPPTFSGGVAPGGGAPNFPQGLSGLGDLRSWLPGFVQTPQTPPAGLSG